MVRVLLFASIALGGCASAAIDQRAAKDSSDARVNAADAYLGPSCRDGSRFGPTCGLVTELVAAEDFRTSFRDKRCVTLDEASCQTAYQRAYEGWLTQRYDAADFAEVGRTCDRYPQRCAAMRDYELRLLDSHNRHIGDRVIDAEYTIEHERREAQARHTQAQLDATAEVVGEILYQTHDGPKCRSYPSVFGGTVNTLCTR